MAPMLALAARGPLSPFPLGTVKEEQEMASFSLEAGGAYNTQNIRGT